MNPISKAITKMAYRHRAGDIFRDFVEMGAIAISNAVDRPQYEKREAQYMNIVKKYDKEEANQIAHMFALTADELTHNPRDVLGETYMELEMGNDRTGQFFTPWHLSVMMAKMSAGDASGIIADKGYITVSEPACGAGGMVIALAEELQHQKINYQQHMHVTAVDIDPCCVHMSYFQFSLLHIPAVVVHGNTLSLEEWNHWYTPAHIMGGWQWKLRAREGIQAMAELVSNVEPIEAYAENASEISAPDAEPVTEKPKPLGKAVQLTLF